MNDKLLIFEDTDGDGKADKMTVFADDLHNPTGFEFYNGGVIVAQAPDLMFLKDTNGDDKADVRERIIHGLDTADTHHTSNSFVLDPGGALYFQEGTFHHSQVEDPVRPAASGSPTAACSATNRGRRSSTSTSPTASPIRTATSSTAGARTSSSTAPARSRTTRRSSRGHLDVSRNKHARPPQVYQQRTRPCRRHGDPLQPALPAGVRGQPARHQRASASRAFCATSSSDNGGEPQPAQELEPILSSSDPNFRPVDCKIGPGRRALLHRLAEPDHRPHAAQPPRPEPRPRSTAASTGSRTKAGRSRESPKIAGEPIEKLLELLKHPEDRVRYRAKIELGGRDTEGGHRGREEVGRRTRQDRRRLRAPHARRRCGCTSTTTSSTSTC